MFLAHCLCEGLARRILEKNRLRHVDWSWVSIHTCLKELYFYSSSEHIMGHKFPDSPCRKMAYTKGFLFLCRIFQQSQVSAFSFTWFSTLLPRRRDQGRHLSCIVFITSWISILISSLGLISDWAKPFEETDPKTNSYKWNLTPEPRDSSRKTLIFIFHSITTVLALLSCKHLFSERVLRKELQELHVVSCISSPREMTWLYCIPFPLCYQHTNFPYKTVNLY